MIIPVETDGKNDDDVPNDCKNNPADNADKNDNMKKSGAAVP